MVALGLPLEAISRQTLPWAAGRPWGEQAAGLDRPGPPPALPSFSSDVQEDVQQTCSFEDARQSWGPDPFPPPAPIEGCRRARPIPELISVQLPGEHLRGRVPPPDSSAPEGQAGGGLCRRRRSGPAFSWAWGKGASCGGREITGRGRWGKKGKLPGWPREAGDLPPEAQTQQGFSAPVASRAAEPDCLGKAGNIAGVLEGDGWCFPPSKDGSGLAASSCPGGSRPGSQAACLEAASAQPGSPLQSKDRLLCGGFHTEAGWSASL